MKSKYLFAGLILLTLLIVPMMSSMSPTIVSDDTGEVDVTPSESPSQNFFHMEDGDVEAENCAWVKVDGTWIYICQ